MPTSASAKWARAHGVDVGERIRGGNAAKVIRIIDDGREKVRRGHQRLLGVQPVHGRVVAGFGAHEQLGRHQALRRTCQNLAEQARRDLAAAATSMRKLRQSNVL